MLSWIDPLGQTSELQTTSTHADTVLVHPRGSDRKTRETAIPVAHLGQVATEGTVKFLVRPADQPRFLRILKRERPNEPVVANISVTCRMLNLPRSEVFAESLGGEVTLNFTAFSPEALSRRERDLRYESLQQQSMAEERAFQRLKPELLKNTELRGKFVAVIDGQVADIDADEERLAVRLLKKHGHRPLHIGLVGEPEPRIFVLPSK